MRDAPLRRACPACLGVALESTPATNQLRVHRCGRCGGSWMTRVQAGRLRHAPSAALRILMRRAEEASFVCHGCHVPMDRDVAACEACGWLNALECPECGREMRRETHNGVTVDVCRPCASFWLDHHELSAVWTAAATAAVASSPGASHALPAGADAGGMLLDWFIYAPDLTVRAAVGAADVAGAGLEVAGNVAAAGVEVVSDAPGLFSAVGDLLGALGDAAGAVFGLIADVLGGLG